MQTGIVIGIVIVVAFILLNVFSRRNTSNISPTSAAELLKDSNVVFLDVRSDGEFKSGHIKGSRLISVGELSSRISELDTVKQKRIIVYCHSGNRSAMAFGMLKNKGFANVENLSGGIGAWTRAGFSVVK